MGAIGIMLMEIHAKLERVLTILEDDDGWGEEEENGRILRRSLVRPRFAGGSQRGLPISKRGSSRTKPSGPGVALGFAAGRSASSVEDRRGRG
jgi:hypothetical protein